MDWTYWSYNILGPSPGEGVMVIFILILIEGILSVDNAAVLATMVMDLPKEQRSKALKYGIFGAYFFRGVCLLLAGWLITIWWLEPLGGLYLLWLAWDYFRTRHNKGHDDAGSKALIPQNPGWLYRNTLGRLSKFWTVVLAVEVMDIAFSIDNVLAAVAYVKNFPMPSRLVLVCIGVFLGILAMRFAATGFVKLMNRFPFLETSAFVVIAILGVKLMLSIPKHLLEHDKGPVYDFLASKTFDFGTSVLTVLVFIVPVIVYQMKTPKVAEGA